MTFLRLFPGKERPAVGTDRKEYIQGIKKSVLERSERAKRRAFRVLTPDMSVRVKELGGKEFPLRDLSVLGIGLLHGNTGFEAGMRLTLSLHKEGQPILMGAVVQIARVGEEVTGCEFFGLDKFQQKLLSQVVMEKQRRHAHTARKKDSKRAVM